MPDADHQIAQEVHHLIVQGGGWIEAKSPGSTVIRRSYQKQRNTAGVVLIVIILAFFEQWALLWAPLGFAVVALIIRKKTTDSGLIKWLNKPWKSHSTCVVTTDADGNLEVKWS